MSGSLRPARADDQGDGASRRVHRLNVNFTDEAYATIQRRAREKGVTVSQHLRDCIALYRWWVEQGDEGSRLLVERDGRVQEVVLL